MVHDDNVTNLTGIVKRLIPIQSGGDAPDIWLLLKPNNHVKNGALVGLGERLKQAREAKGLTQDELAEKVGVRQQTIGEIESGKTKHPRKIDQIAEVLGVSAAWLLYGDDRLTESAIQLALLWQDLPEPIKTKIETLIKSAKP